MTDPHERWEQARYLFDAARALPVEARSGFLERACPDAEIRGEVTTLLRAHSLLHGSAQAGFLAHLDVRRTAALLESSAVPGDLMPGEMIGRYRITRRLGQGGMGVVYLAEDLRLQRPAALKLLPQHLNLDPVARQRFEEEARAASALDHPGIVTIYEIGETPDGRLFIAMAFCDGETLREALARGPLPVPLAVTLAVQIADALAAAHRRGIVHRDVKPHNIMVTAEGRATIVDFGIAKVVGSGLTQTATTPGTVAYMSPEQTRADSPDVRADVWALGAVLYEMVTGARPFRPADAQALIHAIRNDDPEPISALCPDAPAGLSRIVERCLCKDPAQRYPDAGALLLDLRLLTAGSPGITVATRWATEHAGVSVSTAHRAAGRGARVPAKLAVLVALAGVVALGVRWVVVPPPLEARRVAVGVVENRTGMPQWDELANMAADWITHGLWQTGFMEVVPLANYTAQDGGTARGLASGAGARLLVTGALYRDGAVLRLQAQITDVANGRLVGSVEPVDAPITAPMEGVDVLRDRVQAALYPALDTQVTHIRAVQRPPRFEAYSEYLAGRERHAARDLPGALRHFQRAAALDTAFVLPHVTVAIILNMMGNVSGADSIVRTLDRDSGRLDRFSRAHVDWLRGTLSGDQQATFAGMREAARLAPGSTLVSYQLADETVRLGRPRAAIDLLSSFEPERGELRGWFGYWQVLTAAHHLLGNHRRELKEAARARRLYPDDPRALLAELQALAALGRTADIERVLRSALERPATAEPSPGALMLSTGLELRAHASAWRRRSHLAEADRLIGRAIEWYAGRPADQQNVRARYELAIALAAAGRRSEARRLLEELASSQIVRAPGPSPLASIRMPNFPDVVAFRGALGTLAAQDGDSVAAANARTWLEEFRGPYARGRPTYWRAAIAAAQGEREHAVALLRQAFAEGLPYALALHTAPELESLRDYPAFQALSRPHD